MNEIHRPDVGFTQVGNRALQDKNLSLKAKGMYAYLYSKPVKWEFSGNRMVEEMKDGRRSIFGALKELEKAGYLKRLKLSNGKVKYFLDFEPDAQNEDQGLKQPDAHFSKVRFQQSAETSTISNTDSESNTYTESNTIASPTAPQGFSLNKELEKLEESPRRDLGIIALYFRERSPNFTSKEQYNIALKRHLRAAKQLSLFTDNQIVVAADFVKTKYPEWTLETVLKQLTK